jgi:hypothetical protein
MTAAPEAEPSTGWPPAPALNLARQLVAEWRAIGSRATAAERDDPGFGKLQAEIRGDGRQQAQAAQMAAWFATVSIAEDLHLITSAVVAEQAKTGEPT